MGHNIGAMFGLDASRLSSSDQDRTQHNDYRRQQNQPRYELHEVAVASVTQKQCSNQSTEHAWNQKQP